MTLTDYLFGRRLATFEEGEQRVGILSGIPCQTVQVLERLPEELFTSGRRAGQTRDGIVDLYKEGTRQLVIFRHSSR